MAMLQQSCLLQHICNTHKSALYCAKDNKKEEIWITLQYCFGHWWEV